ncbi:MAG: hypothetical protein D6698_01550 [Gammaproteobacteria bacterium]|nr:MAG: hypothetical protein D6698_01550 [Gammaproteobacteria bacterium]
MLEIGTRVFVIDREQCGTVIELHEDQAAVELDPTIAQQLFEPLVREVIFCPLNHLIPIEEDI